MATCEKLEVKFVGGGVRETMCTRCTHRKVCKNIETYMEFLKKSERVCEEFPKDIDFIERKDPVCRFYDKKPDVNLR